MFSAYNIISLGTGALLAVGIPIAAVIIFKLKNRTAWLPSALIGAGTFLVFALILEQLMHSVMLPIIGENKAAYCIYGILAAGVFEETGRFIAYKTLMKKHYSTGNAVLTGLGHGGFEAVALLGLNMASYFFTAVIINITGDPEQFTVMSAQTPEIEAALRAQLTAVSQIGLDDVALSVFERLIAMVFHVCMSVWVYRAASQKGKLWFYPAAVLAHAVLDLFAVLYQVGAVTNLALVYLPMAGLTGIIVFLTVKTVKKLKRPEVY